MSTLDQLKLDLKKMIAANIAGNVLKKLDIVLSDRADCYNNFVLLTMDFKQLDERQILGGSTPEAISIELRNIINRLLKFIDALEETDIRKTAHLQEEIFERILVVCKSPERESFMRKFFPEQYWKGVEYDLVQPRSIAEINNFNLVVFDNSPFDKDDNELLKYYLNDTAPYLLYFGPTNLPLLYDKQYEGKVYSTNFVFSLHARIQEMLHYLKYTRAAPFPDKPINR